MQFKLKIFLSFSLILETLLTSIESAKILGIFPFPGPSQYIFVQPFLKRLAERGHDLTVITHHPQKQKIPNFRDIKLEYENYYDGVIKKVIDMGDSPLVMDLFLEFFKNATLITLENPEVQQLISNKNQHFDLVIVETLQDEALYALGPHFKAPLIGVSTFGTDPTIDSLVGNTSPISYLPLVTSALTDRMDFWQRLENLQLIVDEMWHLRQKHYPEQERMYRKYFPHLNMKLQDIMKNFSLILLNQHFSLSFPRPYVPAMIDVGGMHINHKATPLPKEMEDFIKNAQHGVIYFSMGSNVKSKDFSPEKIKVLLKVLGSLKQRVMWKFELTNLPDKPENVFISSWFPQPDILAHPNVKLFLTHAGLLSTIEAIYHAKPIVGMPVFYDQFLNLERAKLAGFGLGVNYHTFNETDLKEAILEVLNNPKYKEVIEMISKRYHDQPMRPIDKAIFWTEYVLRHKGALHMRVSGQDLSFIAYHSLDTLGFIVLVYGLLPLLLLVIVIKLLSTAVKIIFGNKKSKNE